MCISKIKTSILFLFAFIFILRPNCEAAIVLMVQWNNNPQSQLVGSQLSADPNGGAEMALFMTGGAAFLATLAFAMEYDPSSGDSPVGIIISAVVCAGLITLDADGSQTQNWLATKIATDYPFLANGRDVADSLSRKIKKQFEMMINANPDQKTYFVSLNELEIKKSLRPIIANLSPEQVQQVVTGLGPKN